MRPLTCRHARLLTLPLWPAVPHQASAAHAAVAVASAAGVTAARHALLSVWPEFAAASQRSNQQVGAAASEKFYCVGTDQAVHIQELLFINLFVPRPLRVASHVQSDSSLSSLLHFKLVAQGFPHNGCDLI